jgi:predicted RNA-binding protein associated with RNAse of E/G family
MVNATVDNEPVSIVLDTGQSTTVPSNETWRVSIHLANQAFSIMKIDGIGEFQAFKQRGSAQGNYLDVTLVGGQTITELGGNADSAIFITGFVVNS